MRKGQGLPLKTIVVGALVLLVLVLISGFFIPGVGRMFTSMMRIGPSAGGNMSVSTFRSKCQGFCSSVKAGFTSPSPGISTTQYCTYHARLDQGTEYCHNGSTIVSCRVGGTDISGSSTTEECPSTAS